MLKAKIEFSKNLVSASNQNALFLYLSDKYQVPLSFEDLLRSQIVYSLSAFDKFMHDIIRIGMVEIYKGNRTPTPRYLSEGISIELHRSLLTASIPPPEIIFEQEVVKKLSILSFQEPTKVADGLSLIWTEQHKWQKIAAHMGDEKATVKTTLKLIAMRRNAIVHQADIDPLSGSKTQITAGEAAAVTKFLEKCAYSIYDLVN